MPHKVIGLVYLTMLADKNADKRYLGLPEAERAGDSGMPVLAVIEDPLIRASLLSDVGPAEDALLNDLFFGGTHLNFGNVW